MPAQSSDVARARVVAFRLIGATILFTGTIAAPAAAAECPDRVGPGAFTDIKTLRAWHKVQADLGPRPTASPAHERYIRWIEDRLLRINGLQLRWRPDAIDRWLARDAALGIRTPFGPSPVRVAGPVPYSKPAKVSGRLVFVPRGTPIADANVRGKVVVRDVVPGTIPQAAFFAVAYYVHDPELSLDYTGNYERDWISYAQRVTDLEQAAAKGAAGVVFAFDLPHEQVSGHYDPYEGRRWKVPAVYVGVEQGARLRKAVGKAVNLEVRADQTPNAPTRTVIASLKGQSPERIVIQSHTDGMNAVWDNGPVSILALARYFASLPLECRPRTIEFVFTTAHLYLARSGAERYAEVLDEAYDEGTVAFAVALEHLGAREFRPFPRSRGPGNVLIPTGESEPFVVFVHESPVTLRAVLDSVIDRDLRRTFVLRGADAPQAAIPPHRSYGGEGGPYHQHLIPTVAAITGPTVLFKPAFGMETVDVYLARRQTLAFADVVLKLQGIPREAIAGADTAYRVVRDSTE